MIENNFPSLAGTQEDVVVALGVRQCLIEMVEAYYQRCHEWALHTWLDDEVFIEYWWNYWAIQKINLSVIERIKNITLASDYKIPHLEDTLLDENIDLSLAYSLILSHGEVKMRNFALIREYVRNGMNQSPYVSG
jgi:hypothetical protein